MTEFPAPDDENEINPTAADLMASFRRIERGRCRDCNRLYAGTEALFSIALGFKDAPRCLPCLAQGLDRDAAELCRQLVEFIQRKECYRRVWAVAAPEEAAAAIMPFPDEAATPVVAVEDAHAAIADWDAGDMGCGELVLALRNRLKALPSGSLLQLTARDPAAPVDLPSWCRLTGHALVKAEHPVYLIRRS